MVSPGGEVLLTLTGWGKQRLAAVRPGSEPRGIGGNLRRTPRFPATIFGGNVAFVIGTGDQRRIAIASLRDGRVLRRFSTRSDNGMAASPDGNTLYYSFSGAIWAQPVAGGEPKRITEGIDVTLDPKGEYLYVKRAGKGLMGIIPDSGGGRRCGGVAGAGGIPRGLSWALAGRGGCARADPGVGGFESQLLLPDRDPGPCVEILHAGADSDRWRCGAGRLGSRRPDSGARAAVFVFALAVSARHQFPLNAGSAAVARFV